MGMILSHEDFKIDVLSTKAMAMVSEFALILYRRHGILIDVNSKDALLRVCQYGTRYKDHQLRAICLHIKTELCINLVKNKHELIERVMP